MYRWPWFLVVLVCGCTHTTPDPGIFAYLRQREGVRVVTPDGERVAPGTTAAETFAWDRHGGGFVITHKGTLERVTEEGTRSVLLQGYRSVRFPDVRSRDGAIVVAVTKGAPTENAWRLILLDPEDAEPVDLGPGYDPCFTTDGAGVLFEAFGDDGAWIHHLDFAARERRRLAKGHTPSSSPDGSVYFSSGGSVHRLDFSDRSARPLRITEPGSYDRFASPSRDNSKLIFFRQKDGVDSLIERELATGVERTAVTGKASLPAFK